MAALAGKHPVVDCFEAQVALPESPMIKGNQLPEIIDSQSLDGGFSFRTVFQVDAEVIACNGGLVGVEHVLPATPRPSGRVARSLEVLHPVLAMPSRSKVPVYELVQPISFSFIGHEVVEGQVNAVDEERNLRFRR